MFSINVGFIEMNVMLIFLLGLIGKSMNNQSSIEKELLSYTSCVAPGKKRIVAWQRDTSECEI